mmetsp:Transcript_62420/g.161967  ORF Transcript_62420/g.161967 Transcript_62420/m.161967 type:complete len:83 (+) Transcript_62420:197-445(+)
MEVHATYAKQARLPALARRPAYLAQQLSFPSRQGALIVRAAQKAPFQTVFAKLFCFSGGHHLHDVPGGRNIDTWQQFLLGGL